MGKKHTATRKQKRSRKRPKFSFRNLPEGSKSPTVMVADYVFGDEHSESSVSWLMRKLERYKNGSLFTGSASSVDDDGEDTATSAFPSDLSHPTEDETACKRKLSEEDSGDPCNNNPDFPDVDDFACKCEGPCVWLTGSPSKSASSPDQNSASKVCSPSIPPNPVSKN